MTSFNVILFENFETLDVFGPVAVIGKMPKNYKIEYFSMRGGIVAGGQNAKVDTLPFSELNDGVLLIPGGTGTRTLIENASFIQKIKTLAEEAQYVLSVCTGAALLAKTELLNGRNATTNKMAWEFVTMQGEKIAWDKSARWVKDGKFFTSAGVSAGIDMTLGFIAEIHGINTARDITKYLEYAWDESDKDNRFAFLAN
jgi:putative intracellular protease/amidase